MTSQEQGRTVPLELCLCISVKDTDAAISFIMLLLIKDKHWEDAQKKRPVPSY